MLTKNAFRYQRHISFKLKSIRILSIDLKNLYRILFQKTIGQISLPQLPVLFLSFLLE